MTKYKEVKQISGVILILVGLILILFTSGLVQGTFQSAKSTYKVGETALVGLEEIANFNCASAALQLSFVDSSGSKSSLMGSDRFILTGGQGTSKSINIKFARAGTFSVGASYYCVEKSKIASAWSYKTLTVIASCTNECTTSSCSGTNYIECKTGADGCMHKQTAVITKGLCGAVCISDSDCGINRLCKTTSCVTKCSSHSRKDCKADGDAYWVNSCGEWEDKAQDCSSSQYCENGACITNIPVCDSHAETRCVGSDVYYYDSCGTQEGIVESCSTGEECINGGCKLIESDSCNEKPATPCAAAAWKDVPDCVWDTSLCSTGTTPDDIIGDELDISPTDEEANVSNEEEQKPNYAVFGIGAACFVVGLLLLIFSMSKKRRH